MCEYIYIYIYIYMCIYIYVYMYIKYTSVIGQYLVGCCEWTAVTDVQTIKVGPITALCDVSHTRRCTEACRTARNETAVVLHLHCFFTVSSYTFHLHRSSLGFHLLWRVYFFVVHSLSPGDLNLSEFGGGVEWYWQGKRNSSEKICPKDTVLGANLGLRSKRPKSNPPIYGTV
jgi:hypothetical protein